MTTLTPVLMLTAYQQLHETKPKTTAPNKSESQPTAVKDQFTTLSKLGRAAGAASVGLVSGATAGLAYTAFQAAKYPGAQLPLFKSMLPSALIPAAIGGASAGLAARLSSTQNGSITAGAVAGGLAGATVGAGLVMLGGRIDPASLGVMAGMTLGSAVVGAGIGLAEHKLLDKK